MDGPAGCAVQVRLLTELLALSAACAAASTLVAESRAFAPAREACARAWAPIGHLVACGYCVGHWIGAALVLASGWRMTSFGAAVDLPVAWLAVSWASAWQWTALKAWWAREGF